jgi:hypothetical protein
MITMPRSLSPVISNGDNQRHVGTDTLNDGQLLTKFKTVMSYHKREKNVVCGRYSVKLKTPKGKD